MQDPTKPKVLYEIAGKPLVGHVLDLANKIHPARKVVIIGFGKEKVRDYIDSNYEGVDFAVQEDQHGTGHAMMQTATHLADFDGDILVLYGDVPLLTEKTTSKLIETHRSTNAKATVLSSTLDDPTGYGRIVRTADGKHLERIVEERDASPEIRQIKEWNSGIYVFDAATLYPILQELEPNNDQGEYYLTDVFSLLTAQFGPASVSVVRTDDAIEVAGINTKDQLSALEAEYYTRQALAS
jgi:UDP-N-acetylglucosamine diphosphorylase/glucosamine-1-phosphate N-acetyltransferase